MSFFEGFIEGLKNNPTAIGAVIAAIIASITAIYGVLKTNGQAAYKLLTEHRLKQFDEFSALFTKLRNLCDEHYIKSINDTEKWEYINELHKALNRLKTMFSCENFQEKYVIKEYDKLISEIEKYFEADSENNGDEAFKPIKDQKEIAFILSNIYSWTLWKYIQKLYKSDNKLGKTLDEIFEEVFDNTKELYAQNKLFSIYFIDEQQNLCRKEEIL